MDGLTGFWPDLAINVIVGTIAGGVTNAVAVWMLFHPHERRFGLHGAIPKNKARLAKSIGRTVGERLLTADDIVAELHGAGLRDSMDRKIEEFFDGVLERDLGSLRSMLPATVATEVERTLAGLGQPLAEAWAREVHSEEFERQVRGLVARVREEIALVPVGAVLTPDRRADLAAQAADLAADAIAEGRSDESRTARARLGDLVLRIAGAERTREFVEKTVRDALGRAESRTWGEVLAPLPDEEVVQWVLDAVRSPRAAELAAGAAGGVARGALERPVGRLARWLPPDAARRMTAAAAPAAWSWFVAQVPRVLETLDLEGMVERKVLGFSTQRIEELVRGVTQRELDVIVNLGYGLGAVIGLLTFLAGRAL
ncbi:MAG: DUF445 family protein [Gemmatimonadaceae bacterium]|nr:DUF445 family protein [Gemmatimonadaceae bacterium]